MIEPSADALEAYRDRLPGEHAPSVQMLDVALRERLRGAVAGGDVRGRRHAARRPEIALEQTTSYEQQTPFRPSASLNTYDLDIPIIVGVSSADRRQILDSWIHSPEAGGQRFLTVNCSVQHDVIVGVVDCHRAVARAALEYFGGQPGMYIDLEDNCHPTLRLDWQNAYDAARALDSHREWKFVHLSRFPFPFGLADPHCPLTGSLYYKPWTFNELAQAMLCTTEFASWIQTLTFTEPYDDMLMPWQHYVVYPSLFQRHTEHALATHATTLFASGSPLTLLRDITFQPSVYLLIEVANVFGFWLLLTLILACIPCCCGVSCRDGCSRRRRVADDLHNQL